MLYNSKRRHGSNEQRSTLNYKKIHEKMVFSSYSNYFNWNLIDAYNEKTNSNLWGHYIN